VAEVPDLTHPATVEIFRRWDQKEVAFIQLLRFIRIFSAEPEITVVSRPGKHLSITGVPERIQDDGDEVMGDVDDKG
jgi:translation machinery-associated protein 16